MPTSITLHLDPFSIPSGSRATSRRVYLSIPNKGRNRSC